MFRYILGPSPALYMIKQVHSHLFFRGGDITDQCLDDTEFFEIISEKPTRMTNKELTSLLSTKSKKLTKNQKLIKSILEEINVSRVISENYFKNLEETYELRRKYKNYLKIKRIIPLSLLAPFTGNELSKMAYAAALGSKSIGLTLPGLIGYSLPSFFFFHMSYYYAPDKLKPICQACKYTLGAPVWIACYLTDELSSTTEEKFFGQEVPIDVCNTGGTIPADMGNINDLRQVLDDMRGFGQDLTRKSY